MHMTCDMLILLKMHVRITCSKDKCQLIDWFRRNCFNKVWKKTLSIRNSNRKNDKCQLIDWNRGNCSNKVWRKTLSIRKSNRKIMIEQLASNKWDFNMEQIRLTIEFSYYIYYRCSLTHFNCLSIVLYAIFSFCWDIVFSSSLYGS
jgi:hypothetical protein